ncbi:MAG TPA: preprotein translocase subunit SecG [Chitinophagales bacterium]|nr:preprotein translocase subunit SecG [Chitinophagales bacterium]
MFTFLTVLIILVSLFIILVVLIQNPKGGGLNGGIGSAASSVIGVQSAGDVMEKTTWGSAIVLLALCVMTAFVVPKEGAADKVKTLTEGAAKSAPSVPTTPTTPAAPQNNQPANNPLAPK